MAINYHIDHDRRLVVAQCNGRVSSVDALGYKREVWRRPEVVGYDELVDVTDVEEFAFPSPTAPILIQLARESVCGDDPAGHSRFAIVAPAPLAYALGRMYAIYRKMQPGSTKEVRVFRHLADAVAFLGIESIEPTEKASCHRPESAP